MENVLEQGKVERNIFKCVLKCYWCRGNSVYLILGYS